MTDLHSTHRSEIAPHREADEFVSIDRLRADIANLTRSVAQISKTLGPNARTLLNLITEVAGDALGQQRVEIEAQFKHQLKEAKAQLQEQLNYVETRIRELPPGLPGRDGLPGPAGRDGAPGAPGQDGLGFDDLKLLRTGEREITLEFSRGDKVKRCPVSVPGVIYRGPFKEGESYELGDMTTWAGSLWHCNVSSTSVKPGVDCKGAWTLCTKSGRDGRDGQDGAKGERGPEGRPGRDLTRG